jgi:hypothetical protein
MRHISSSVVVAVIVFSGILAAQDHPALVPPPSFSVTPGSDHEQVFQATVPNGDRLRLRVLLVPGGGDPEALAKGPALEEGDQIRAETRQDVRVGTLSGVSYSVFGKSETIEGVSYTRYRRVLGLRIEGQPVPFAARADILAREPRPAQSTLEAMARALAEWQQRLGGVAATPPAEPGADPASKPALGGDQIVKLTGGGDLEIQVPAFWGRANLVYGGGQEEILLGPARDVIQKTGIESIAKDKDRIGPYISIARLQKDTFKDLVDVQLLDIKESLLADYVARMSDSGITLTLSEDRDEGTLGSRTVISVPFEEKRASGTQHRGRAVFMMHKGSLVVVTASHPLENFDEGWPDVAKAFDTLLFTGDVEPESQPTESRGAEGRTGVDPEPVPPAPEPPPERQKPAPPEWTRETRQDTKTIEIPVATPISLAVPSAWTLLGDADPSRAALGFVATAEADRSSDPLASALRIAYHAFREDLMGAGGIARLASLMRLDLEQKARAAGLTLGVISAEAATVSGRPAFAIQYTLTANDRSASGTIAGTVQDGTVAIFDLRIGAADAQALGALAGAVLSSIDIKTTDNFESRAFGAYEVLAPAGWEISEAENAGRGRNVFMRSPAGVDLRFQTAVQRRPSAIDQDVLRRVATGFLVDGLKIVTLKDMAGAGRLLVPGGGPGMRVEVENAQMSVIAFCSMMREHMIFAVRGAPATYRGRDLAIAARVIESFVPSGIDRSLRSDPPRVAGAAVSHRVVFARTELDAVGTDGTVRSPSSLYVALLPDGNAGVVANRGGRREDLRGTYRIEGDQVIIEGAGIGRLSYRFADGGETLRGESPGDELFRARHEETP